MHTVFGMLIRGEFQAPLMSETASYTVGHDELAVAKLLALDGAEFPPRGPTPVTTTSAATTTTSTTTPAPRSLLSTVLRPMVAAAE